MSGAGGNLQQAIPKLFAASGQVHVSPNLQIQQTPDAIGRVVLAAVVLLQQVVEEFLIDVSSENALRIAQIVNQNFGPIAQQPVRESAWESPASGDR